MAATLTAGTFLLHGSGAGFAKLVDITEYPDIGSTIDSEDVTTLSDACHKYIDALPDPGGSIEFNGWLNETDYAAVQAIADTEQDFVIAFGGSKSGDTIVPDTITGTVGGTLTVGNNTILAVSFKGKIRVRITGAGTAAARPVAYTITPTTGFTDQDGHML